MAGNRRSESSFPFESIYGAHIRLSSDTTPVIYIIYFRLSSVFVVKPARLKLIEPLVGGITNHLLLPNIVGQATFRLRASGNLLTGWQAAVLVV